MNPFRLSRAFLSLALLFSAFSANFASYAQSASTLPIMPLPASVTTGQGEFLVDGQFSVSLDGFSDPRLLRARERFLNTLTSETGQPMDRVAVPATSHFHIHTGGPSAVIQKLGEDESYQLVVSPEGVNLTAPNPLGVMHGLQTFLQLVRITPRGFTVPAVTIDDKPRFPWRGLMIDSSRSL